MIPAVPAQRFGVLVVCTANISRSPVVERLLASGLGESAEVGSAGVMALVGHPIDPEMLRRLQGQLDGSGFVARQVTEPMLRQADLILALTRQHRARILEIAPSAVRRTFTLREFARMLRFVDHSNTAPAATPGERLRAIVPLAAAGRTLTPRVPGEQDDVADPYGRGGAAYDAAIAGIREATDTIIRAATG